MKMNLDVTKLHYSEQILPVPWHFVILRFHSILNLKGLDSNALPHLRWAGQSLYTMTASLTHRIIDHWNILKIVESLPNEVYLENWGA